MKLLIIYFLTALLCSFNVISKEREQALTLVTVENIAILPTIYRKVSLAYEKINYSINIIEMPSKRALVEAKNNQLIDGDLVRAIEAESLLLDYIRIPVPLHYAKIKAYIANSDIEVSDWNSLANYEVATVRGILATSTNSPDKVFSFREFSSTQQVLDIVKKNRLDVALLIAETVEDEDNISTIKKDFPYTVVIEKKPFFHFIHKRHKAIVPELTKAFEEVFFNVESDIKHLNLPNKK